MPRFLITILVIVGVYYGFKYLFRFVFPLIMNRWMNKMMDGSQNPFNQQNRQMKEEGEVTITQKPKSTDRPSKNEGEFVDFEELE